MCQICYRQRRYPSDYFENAFTTTYTSTGDQVEPVEKVGSKNTETKMSIFKVGDRIQALSDCSGMIKGNFYTIREDGKGLVDANCTCPERWELITNNNNKKTMINLKGLMSRLLDADTQKLYKAEYIDGNLALTDKGKNKIMEILFVANKVELVKLAEAELAEAEKNEK